MTGMDWGSIAGHEEPVARLRMMLREGRLPHAVLLAGPEGVGKHLAAQVLAAALLCGQGDSPCGKCPSCRAFQAGAHPDFYELRPEARGKSARMIRIEQVREMQEEASRKPVLSQRRVVIVDDAHLMNEMAENSLLKTLEEPAGQTVFLLVTSARSSLLDTIVSRCMPMSFGMLPMGKLAGLLTRKGVPAGEAEELALLSDGSPGRAEMLRGSGSLREDAGQFLQGLRGMQMEAVWQRGESMGKMSREQLSEWFLYLNMMLRDLLVLHGDGGSSLLYCRGSRPRLLEMLPQFSVAGLFALVRLVREAQQRLQANVGLRLFMEGFFIRCIDCVYTRVR